MTTWAEINRELAELKTWQKILASNTWKSGFAHTVAASVFYNMADDATRFKVWIIMCKVASEYHLDIYYYTFQNAQQNKIAVGRKNPNKGNARTTPFTITQTYFHKGNDNPDIIKFDQVADAATLKHWLPTLNWPKYLNQIPARANNAIYLPNDFADLLAQKKEN